jgi:hypothetical protein
LSTQEAAQPAPAAETFEEISESDAVSRIARILGGNADKRSPHKAAARAMAEEEAEEDQAEERPDPEAEEPIEDEDDSGERAERDEDGDEPAPEEHEAEEQEEADDEPPIDLPRSWDKARAKEWAKLPRSTQDYIVQREAERDTYLQRTTQEAANERRAIQHERTAVLSRLAQYLHAAEQVPEPNWVELAQTADPRDFALQQAQWTSYKNQLSQLRENERHLRQQEINDRARSNVEAIRTERDKLLEKLPVWRNPLIAKKEKADLTNYLLTSGFAREEIFGDGSPLDPGLVDHRALIMARKAMLYDQMQSKKPQVVEQRVAKARPMVQPGTAKPVGKVASLNVQARNDRAELKRTGSEDAAKRLILAKLRARG